MRLPFPHRLARPVALALLLSALLAACGGPAVETPSPDAPPADASPQDAGPASADPGTELPQLPPPTDQAQAVELVVFAAASLTNAFDEMAAAFEAQNPGVRVVLNYGASSQLATQIVEGAQADVFAAANEMQMGIVVSAGRIDGPSVTFATNRLAILVPADNPAGIGGLDDLAEPGVRLVLAMPGVPARDYANQVFETLAADPAYGIEYLDAINLNIVSEEQNVRQVAAKVTLAEADAGVVYTSDVTPDIANRVQLVEIPDEANVTATYPIGLVTGASQPETGRAFIAFVLSDEGQAILDHWGLGSAPGD